MTRKGWIKTLMVLSLMGPAGWALPPGGDPVGFLQKRDAERLEAFVLAENLVDFAARAGSARAYLMAAELRLLYPVQGDGEKAEPVSALLERARALAPNDAGVQDWAGQLARLAAKAPRGEAPWRRLDLRVGPDEAVRRSLPAASGPRLVVLPNLAPGAVQLSILEVSGAVRETTSEPGLYFEGGEQPVTLQILNTGSLPLDLIVLYR